MTTEHPKSEFENYWKDQVNKICALPDITERDAYTLWFACVNLVSALNKLRVLVPHFGPRPIIKLVKKLAHNAGYKRYEPRLARLAERAICLIKKPTKIKRRKAKPRTIELAVASTAGVETRAEPF